jgi:hypothetical protein
VLAERNKREQLGASRQPVNKKPYGPCPYFACQLRRDAQNGAPKRAIEQNMRDSSSQNDRLAHVRFSSPSHFMIS